MRYVWASFERPLGENLHANAATVRSGHAVAGDWKTGRGGALATSARRDSADGRRAQFATLKARTEGSRGTGRAPPLKQGCRQSVNRDDGRRRSANYAVKHLRTTDIRSTTADSGPVAPISVNFNHQLAYFADQSDTTHVPHQPTAVA